MTANDLGIDTIEVGAMIATLMDAGHAEFGDTEFMEQVFDDIRAGNERGKIWPAVLSSWVSITA